VLVADELGVRSGRLGERRVRSAMFLEHKSLGEIGL
jgi:hypothetical protein